MPKSKEQFEQIKQERIKQIYRHALYLFALRGLDGVTSDEITRAAGCSHGLLYHYFDSKEDLFQKLVTEVANKLEEEIVKGVNFDQKPKFALQDLLDAYLVALNSSRDDYACTIYLLTNLYIQSRKLPKSKQQKFKYHVFDNVFNIIEAGKEDGEFVNYPTKEITITVLSVIKGIAYNRINLGYKRCTIPRSELIMRMVIKNL